MFCTKCGTKNEEGSKFCSKCGNKFGSKTMKNNKGENLFISYFKDLFNFNVKPVKSMSNMKEIDNLKTSFVYAGLSFGLMYIVNFLFKLLYAGIMSLKLSSKFYKVNYLKALSFSKILLLSIPIYLLIIFGIAGLITVVGIIFKKKVNFARILSLVSLAVIPYSIGSMILYTIFSTFSTFLALMFMILGIVYSLVLVINIVEVELKVEKDIKLYVTAIVLGVIGMVSMIFFYITYTKGFSFTLKSNPVSSALSALNSLFK